MKKQIASTVSSGSGPIRRFIGLADRKVIKLLHEGFTVKVVDDEGAQMVQWTSPSGDTGSDYRSTSLLDIPAIVEMEFDSIIETRVMGD